jgi:hypothetical protein
MIVDEKEYLDFSHVPQSRGIPSYLPIIALVGVIGIFLVGGFSAFLSGSGHLWPSEKTLRYPLGQMPTGLNQ